MSALKKIAPVPAVSVRSLNSASSLSSVVSSVKRMLPATLRPVVMTRSLLSVVGPLRRMLSPVVVRVSTSSVAALSLSSPALNVMPPVIVSSEPMSNACDVPSPSMLIVVSGARSPVMLSAPPKRTPASASSMIKLPSALFPAAPMLALKLMLPVPAASTRRLASVVPVCDWLSIVANCVKSTFAPPVADEAVSSVSMRTSLLSVTAPLKRTCSLSVVSVSVLSLPELSLSPPPLSVMPPVMRSSEPISNAVVVPSPTMRMSVTGPRSPVAVSAPPKVTPASASSTIKLPSSPFPFAPMLALKLMLALPASSTRRFASAVV